MFVYGGLDALQHPEGKVKAAEPVAGPIAERIPHLTTDTETLIRMNGAVMVGAGALLATGKFRRLASAALIVSLLPTTYAGHRFWEESDDASRTQQRIHFLKNMGLLGGLILSALDTEGQPSWSWRAKGTALRARRAASDRLGGAAARGAPKQVERRLVGFSRMSEQSAKRAARAAAVASKRAGQLAQPMVSGGVQRAQRAGQTAQPVVSGGVQRASQMWSDVVEHLPVP
jgi:uncharacterized membrane protein YphA (DoxX/SURF4 family)